jgi:hypothetical protein
MILATASQANLGSKTAANKEIKLRGFVLSSLRPPGRPALAGGSKGSNLDVRGSQTWRSPRRLTAPRDDSGVFIQSGADAGRCELAMTAFELPVEFANHHTHGGARYGTFAADRSPAAPFPASARLWLI